ncbi:uncharacterized protein LOC135486770 [Lineus longissimus]|uniref:uncharacterized protein LOC135486770 n=1 Tax=Lineus longissimus TaxID=88925 RepID=UPI00315DA177
MQMDDELPNLGQPVPDQKQTFEQEKRSAKKMKTTTSIEPSTIDKCKPTSSMSKVPSSKTKELKGAGTETSIPSTSIPCIPSKPTILSKPTVSDAKRKIVFTPEKMKKRLAMPTKTCSTLDATTASPSTSTITLTGYVHDVVTQSKHLTFKLQTAENTYQHIITFVPEQFKATLINNMENTFPIEIQNHGFIQSKNSKQMDVKLTSKTKITSLPKQLTFCHKPPSTVITAVNSIHHLPAFQKINIEVIVLAQEDNTETKNTTSGPMTLMNKYVSDASGLIKLTSWGDHIHSLEVGNSFKLTNVSVKEFNEEKRLSTTAQTIVTPITQLTKYIKMETATINAELVGVDISKHYRCNMCSTLNNHVDSPYDRCQNCNCQQKLTKVENTRKTMLQIELQ